MKKRSSIHLPAFMFAFTLVASLLSGCHQAPAEQQVRKAIATAATAARERDGGALNDLLTKDFVAPSSTFDRRRLIGLLRLARLRNEKISVLTGPVNTERHGKRIVAHFTVTLGGGGNLIPHHLGVYTVKTAWRDDDGTWRCYSASWKHKL